MADGAVILGVTAVLTSGVFGPLVVHHAKKDRDVLGDRRATLDGAVETLAVARAQEAWLEAEILNGPPLGLWTLERTAEIGRKTEELLHQLHRAEAFSLKLQLRFGVGEVTDAYTLAAGAINEQALAMGSYHRLGSARSDMEAINREAEATYLAAYERFIAASAKWYADASSPFTYR